MPAALVDGILEADTLSQSSKTQYLEKLSTLTKLTGKPVEYLIDHPQHVFATIKRHYPSPLTQRAFIASIKALFHHNKDLKADKSEAYQLYTEYQAHASQTVTDRYMAAEPSEKERKNWVTWSDVLAKERHLAMTEYGSDAHLMLAMYCLIEPLRQDYGALRILVDRLPPDTARGNYLSIARDGSWGRITLNTYKTAKKYGTYQRSLPLDLLAVIKASLVATPRAYLFVDDSGAPYKKTNSFTQFSNRTLRRIFGKNFTVSLMRHSHISNIDFNASTPGELFQTSKNMAHSISMQQLYRRKVEPENLDISKLQPGHAPPPLPETTLARPAVADGGIHAPGVRSGVAQGDDGSRYLTLTI